MKKRCIRKHWPLVNPITLALEGCTTTPEEQLDKLRLRELSAIDNFSHDRATPFDFRDLCDMLNLAETMGLSGIGPEALPVCEAVQAHLLASKAEHDKSGRLPMSQEGIDALHDLYALHDLQRTSVDRSQFERSIDRTRNKIRSSHPGLKVLT